MIPSMVIHHPKLIKYYKALRNSNQTLSSTLAQPSLFSNSHTACQLGLIVSYISVSLPFYIIPAVNQDNFRNFKWNKLGLNWANLSSSWDLALLQFICNKLLDKNWSLLDWLPASPVITPQSLNCKVNQLTVHGNSLRNMKKMIHSDSDISAAMIASQTFDEILQMIQKSNLNFLLQVSPFSANISLNKSLVTRNNGCLPPDSIPDQVSIEVLSAENHAYFRQ